LSAFAAAPLWSDEVFRSVDADGNVRYSDRPEGNDVEKVFIVVPRGRATPRPAVTAPPAPEPAEQAEAPASPPAAPTAEERARNCATATERLERYEVSHRLYRTRPDGEREYLSDAEIDEARARAAAEVQNWCSR
jgi:hypothetical protein